MRIDLRKASQVERINTAQAFLKEIYSELISGEVDPEREELKRSAEYSQILLNRIVYKLSRMEGNK